MFFLFVCVIVGGAHGAQLPSEVKLCHRSSPDFDRCVARNIGDALQYFAKGNKVLGVPQMEPFFVEQLEIKGESTQSVSIQQKYNNVYIHGMTNADFTKNFELNLDDKCGWKSEVMSPMIRMEADYEIKGQILVFPLQSHGKCNITQYNVATTHAMTCEKYRKKNQTYVRMTNYSMDMKPERLVYNFENIFPGNEQISNEILKTLNENALSIFNDVKGGFEEVFSLIHLRGANGVFSKIPLNQIFLD